MQLTKKCNNQTKNAVEVAQSSLNYPITQIGTNMETKYLKKQEALRAPWLRLFLSDPGVPGVRSMGPDVRHSVQDYVQT